MAAACKGLTREADATASFSLARSLMRWMVTAGVLEKSEAVGIVQGAIAELSPESGADTEEVLQMLHALLVEFQR